MEANAVSGRFLVCGIAGSLRAGSYNRALLRAARELAPDDVEVRIFEGLGDIPPYNADVEAEGDPEPVVALKRAIGEADALLVVTPEYNYGMPGVLKNAVDWASRPAGDSVLNGMPAGIMGATPGRLGTARAQMTLRQSFVFTRTLPLPGPEVLVARAAEKFDDDLNLTDEPTADFVRGLLERLRDWTRRLGGEGQA